MNSREKGKRGERLWRDELCAAGFTARRGQQFSGSADSPDVVCAELGWVHFEVKCVERLNIEEAMEQARIDCGSGIAECGVPKVPVVAHKRCRRPWLVTMGAEVFFRLLRGDFDTNYTNDDGAARSERTPHLGINPNAWARQEPCPTDTKISAAAAAAAGSNKPNQNQQLKTDDEPST